MATSTPSLDRQLFRTVEDGRGRLWHVGIRGRAGMDFKGRYFFVALPEGGSEFDEVALEDLRWNSEATARRTLETMSDVELRRRLRGAKRRRTH